MNEIISEIAATLDLHIIIERKSCFQFHDFASHTCTDSNDLTMGLCRLLLYFAMWPVWKGKKLWLSVVNEIINGIAMTLNLHVTIERIFQFHEFASHTCTDSNDLTGGNWQKWKRVFLTCPCHEIYRDEAVGLKNCKNTWKITIFVKMWNLGQYRENLIFCQ